MNRKIAALLLSLVIVFSLIVLIVEIAPVVKSSKIIYVDDVAGVGPNNPAEDYTSIQDAIDAANPGDTVFVYGGKYLETVDVDKTINLTGENRDNTTIDGQGSGDVVFVRANWVNVSGFMVMNGDDDGIVLFGVQNCRIFNNIAHSNDHYGICLYGSFGNNITDNTALNSHACIYLGDSFSNNITGNTALSNDQDDIALHNSWGNRIIGNNVSNSENGIRLLDAHDNTIINNNASFNKNTGIYLDDSKRNNIINNTMINNGIWIFGDALEYWNTHDIDTSNTVNGKSVQYWKNQTGGEVSAGAGQVILANCTNVRVEDQEPTHGTVGIALGYSSNNYIVGNNVSSNIYSGIYLFRSNGNTITNNNASSNSTESMGAGIWLRVSNGNNIIGNKASFISAGIYNDYSSGNNMIENIVSNTGYGFFFEYKSSNNTIVNNIVSSNMIGIWLVEETSNNLIYHNIFTDNSFQVIDETNNSNQWDNGYPSGGNYWSDFDEPSENAYDDYQGINQDDPTSGDGIVDNGTVEGGGMNPYVIDEDSQDNYPLLYLIESPYLYPGWNLISIPLVQSDTKLGAVLSPITGSYNSVWAYNLSDSYDHWKHYHTSMPVEMNELDNIDHTMGFWIYITEPGGVLFDYNGTQPTVNQTIALYQGWNLVGYPSKSNKLRDDALGDLIFGDDIYKINWFNKTSGRIEEVNETDYMKICQGYWIYANKNCVWEVPL